MSHSTTPTHSPAPNQKVVSVNWSLLWRRLRARAGQLFTSARYHARHTEYHPPAWAQQLRLTWFRLGLMAITVFVFTQKQIDFSITIGGDDALASVEEERGGTTQLAMLPGAGESSPGSKVAAPAWSVDRYDPEVVARYVERFHRVARTEEEKYSIPAPAKMAMGILESDAGRDRAAREGNNHFPGVRSHGRYDNAWSGWRAHSEYLSRRFPELADASVNYQQWIDALGRTGYTEDATYGQKLIEIIERYDLASL